MKPITFVTAFATVLSFVSLLGCGTNSKLQSITLTAGGTTGTVEVKGIGGTLQLTATGIYTNTKKVDLTQRVTYAATPEIYDPNQLSFLGVPPQTVTVSSTGLVTAVDPAVCTFHDVQPDPLKPPAYVLTGAYKIVATFGSVSSQPIFVPVASAAGDTPNTGACGP